MPFTQLSFRFLTRIPLALLLLSAQVLPSAAQEPFATYPPLPAGVSSVKVFDVKGRFVGRILPEKRYWTPIERIPTFLQNAVVAVEDSRFWEHSGIDVRGIARALVKDVVKRRMAEGGSTITQQLVKNKFLSGEKTLDRKVQEGLLAIDMEKKYSKKQILEMYFNEIYYGNGAWGIGQAARLYFDKSPEQLTEGECAMLAGVQKAPGKYNPLGKAADVVRRRDVVLMRMADLKMITPAQKEYLRSHPPVVVQPGEAREYLQHLRNKLVERLGPQSVEQGGLEVTAALDLELQKEAEKVLRDGVKRAGQGLQGALICIDPATGDVLAAVGGVDLGKGSYNRAFFAKRQPGSSIKPFIYASALDVGFTPATIWDDTPVSYPVGNGESWTPLNYGREQYGELPLRKALAHSNNVIAVKLLDTIGVPYFVDHAARFGLTLHPQGGLSLALGTDEVTPQQLATAYAPFATNGIRPEARTIVRIYDRNRNAWIDNPPVTSPAIDPAAAYVTTQILKDVMTCGTAKNLKKFARAVPSAGKTGTTDDYRDAWFVGFTPRLVTAVWVGHDKPKPEGKGFTGGAISAPIWEHFMRQAVKSYPAGDFVQPEGVVAAVIDPATGQLAGPDCPEKREEFFVAGSEPKEWCARHGATSPPETAPPN